MKWLDDKVSSEHRANVLRAAEGEMEQMRTVSVRYFLHIAGATLGACAGFFIFKRLTGSARDEATALAENDPDMLENLDLMENLDFLENLETIEHWQTKEG